MHVAWISGWGVAPESLRALAESFAPGAIHTFHTPVRDVARSVGGTDRVVAWSLGAWQMLEAASRGQFPEGEVLLLAPFLAFSLEHGLGGRCSQTQVRWLRRWVQRDPSSALADFYARAGLGPAPQGLPYAESELLAGLDQLSEDASPELRRFAAAGLPERWRAVIGDEDPLLDASVICQWLRPCRVVAGAGHTPASLLGAAWERTDAI